ncbi:hypothetical protein [Pyxidicoccus sp. MSG2]|uniref:hypothetical protein n=1 Tax=Pyxidicoccus sp. MSG2 TaxID=2996790 RepID=UPI00226F89AC|nr:hypothetical protein [Pyxidicoccus sp. MSG2]MCY1023536.1 hypothetical protein [Pyxidicoccus sp. MSG2]
MTHVVAPACDDMGVLFETENSEEPLTHYEPVCFPPYFYKYEGYFLASTGQAVPRLEKTCGAFRVLVVFFDTAANRDALRMNPEVSEVPRMLLDADVHAALTSLFVAYVPATVFSGLAVRPQVSFTFDVKVFPAEHPDALSSEQTAGFAAYDAVVFLEDLPGQFAGYGVGRWPMNHPIFRTDGPAALRIDPLHVSPGLFYNELFRRNVPVLLAEYTKGPETFEEVGGIVYDRTQVFNPRTGRVLEREDFALLSLVLNGWHDVDEDGIQDCVDPEIHAGPGNVDADWVPDTLDPDLGADNGPFLWTRG